MTYAITVSEASTGKGYRRERERERSIKLYTYREHMSTIKIAFQSIMEVVIDETRLLIVRFYKNQT